MKKIIFKMAMTAIALMAFILSGMSFSFASAAIKPVVKTVLPQPVISHIGTSYLKGERPYINISSTGYTKNVQYKLFLTNNKTKKNIDVIKAYTVNYNPKTSVGVTLPLLDSGDYTLTLYVRRSGTKASYDKYTYKKFSIVNNLVINNTDTVYGKINVNKTVYGDVYANADNITLNGLIVKGTIFINPGKNGTTNLNNVQASKIEVQSGGENSIHLNSVKAESLNINSQSKTRVEINGSTNIVNTQVQSDAILDSSSGIFGNITVNNIKGEESKVELRGEFINPIVIKTKALLTTNQSAKISKVQIETDNKDDIISLNGVFDNVEINKEAYVKIAAMVNNINVNTTAVIEKAEGTEIKNIKDNGNKVEVKEPSNNNQTTDPNNGQGTNPPATETGDTTSPKITYAGVVLKDKSVSMTKVDENTYSIDLSGESNSQVFLRIAVSASRDCQLTTSYTPAINLTGGTTRNISVKELIGYDNPPEGVSFSTIRSYMGGSMNLSVTLETPNGITSTVNLQIKL